jgi:hypothetical protein
MADGIPGGEGSLQCRSRRGRCGGTGMWMRDCEWGVALLREKLTGNVVSSHLDPVG